MMSSTPNEQLRPSLLHPPPESLETAEIDCATRGGESPTLDLGRLPSPARSSSAASPSSPVSTPPGRTRKPTSSPWSPSEASAGSGLDEFAKLVAHPEVERFREVFERGQTALKVTEKNQWLLDTALDHLTLGRAHLGLALTASGDNRTTKFAQAAESLDRAVDGLRRAGIEDQLPLGLLARATLRRFRSDFPGAAADRGMWRGRGSW